MNKLTFSYARFINAEIIKKKNFIFPEIGNKYDSIVSDSVHRCTDILMRTDALYHDLEHTTLVTLCGQDIFAGKKILEGNLKVEDWIHYTIALLFHDIGYVRNILNCDKSSEQIINSLGDKVEVPANATDAFLTTYHVERAQIFLKERNWDPIIDVDLVCDFIKNTEFPMPKHRITQNTDAKQMELAQLVSSADLIGQLADPGYFRKIPALYYEFEEIGANKALGYKHPIDLKKSYPSFFYNYVQPKISDALNYLDLTTEGQQWSANLNYHIFSEEHRAILSEDGISLLQIISKKMLEETDFFEKLEFIIRKICEYQNWPVGHAYVLHGNLNSKLSKLSPTKIWYIENNSAAISNFVEVTRNSEFSPGEGLPGRVLSSKSAAWIEDVTSDVNFPRAKLAEDIGVKGAFAFPISDQEGVRYVLEFYSLNIEKPDVPTLSFMSQIGYEISKYL